MLYTYLVTPTFHQFILTILCVVPMTAIVMKAPFYDEPVQANLAAYLFQSGFFAFTVFLQLITGFWLLRVAWQPVAWSWGLGATSTSIADHFRLGFVLLISLAGMAIALGAVVGVTVVMALRGQVLLRQEEKKKEEERGEV